MSIEHYNKAKETCASVATNASLSQQTDYPLSTYNINIISNL